MTKKYIGILVVILITINSCKKEGYHALSDAKAETPIIVSTIYAYRPGPTILASKLANKISFTLQIPEDNARSIKEITKISATASGNFVVIRDSVNVKVGFLWVNTPITVNSKSYTFNTTFDEYKLKTGMATVPTSNALLARDFYFQIKLDNDQIIYPTSVKVWVTD